VVNISSFVGQAGNFGQATIGQQARHRFTKSVAIEVAKYNVTVNAIAPASPRRHAAKVRPTCGSSPHQDPHGPVRQPEDIARAVAFLCAEGDYITGQQINVNGGVYM